LFRILERELLAGGAGVLISVGSDGSPEALPTLAQVDDAGVINAISAPLAHFSEILQEVPKVTIEMSDVPDQELGVPFEVSAGVFMRIGESAAQGGVDALWKGGCCLEPEFVALPRKSGQRDYVDSQIFVCAKPGAARAEYEANFSFSLMDVVHEAQEVSLEGSIFAEDHDSLLCLPEPGATAVETSFSPPRKQPRPRVTADFSTDDFIGQLTVGESEEDLAQVAVDIKDLAGNLVPDLDATIRSGSCNDGGDVAFELETIVEGSSVSELEVTLDELLGGYSVDLKSASEQTSFACVDIPKGRAIALEPGPNGDQTPGTAVLTSEGPRTRVLVTFTPDAELDVQPVWILDSACGAEGEVAFELEMAFQGWSESYLDAGREDLLSGGYSVRVGKSDSEPDAITACGNLSP
jgi:hypothetical protein